MKVFVADDQFGCLEELSRLSGGTVETHVASALDDYIRVVGSTISQIEKQANLLEFRRVASI